MLFRSQDAILSGKVKYSSVHPNQSHTENWVQNGDSIYWKLNMKNAGNYRIEIQYGCPVSEIGSEFQVRLNSIALPFTMSKPFDSEILPDRDYVPRTESVERNWSWMGVATGRIDSGELILGIKLLEKQNQNAGMIKAIRLIKL